MGARTETKLRDDKRGIISTIEDSGSEGPGRFLACLRWHQERTSISIQHGFDSLEEAEHWLYNAYKG